MYSLLTKLERTELLKRQLPGLIVALVIAELFYKFHSFVLECGAFLATWFVIDAAISLVVPDRQSAGDRERA
jgi:hypothetical protein